MNEDHERIDELLAGHALGSLSGDDAEEAERILVEHVPGCPQCRDTLLAFQSVAGELALAATPRTPPDLLLPRLRQELSGGRFLRRRPLSMWASVGVAAVALVAVVTWNMLLNQRVSNQEGRSTQLSNLLSFMAQPSSDVVPLQPKQPTRSPVLAMYAPGVEHMYLFSTDVPDPAPGHVYRLWLGRDGDYVKTIEFLPDDGFVELHLLVDLTVFDEILITEESTAPPGSQPGGILRWIMTLKQT